MEELKTIKEGFVGEIRGIIDKAREGAVRSVDFSKRRGCKERGLLPCADVLEYRSQDI